MKNFGKIKQKSVFPGSAKLKQTPQKRKEKKKQSIS